MSWVKETESHFTKLCTLRLSSWESCLWLLVPSFAIGSLTALSQPHTNSGSSFMLMVLASLWIGGSTTLLNIVDRWEIIVRGRRSGMSFSAFAAAELIFSIFVSLAQSLLLLFVLTSAFRIVPSRPVSQGHEFEVFLILSLVIIGGAFLGLIVSAFVKNTRFAAYCFPLLLVPQLLLSGIIIPVENTPPFLIREAHCKEKTPSCLYMPAEQKECPCSSVGAEKEEPRHWASLLSKGMIARWGVEALAAVHGEDLQFPPRLGATDIKDILKAQVENQITLRFRLTYLPDQQDRLIRALNRLCGRSAAPSDESHSAAIVPYAAVLLAFAVIEGLLFRLVLWCRDPLHR